VNLAFGSAGQKKLVWNTAGCPAKRTTQWPDEADRGRRLLRLFLLSFAIALGLGYLILSYEHLHGRFTRDVASRGSHKVHTNSVTRIGGISIFLAWLAGLVASGYFGNIAPHAVLLWAACLLPAFVGGLTEDFTKRVSPVTRLLAAFLSAALAYFALGASVSRVDIFGIDALLAISTVSFLFTVLAVAGVAHAINIIDGLNGLASGVCLVALLAIGYVAYQVSDRELVLMCGLGAGAVLGFRVWNYPSGRLFCGDGGAYFLGAYVAILSTLLVHRHYEVSAWFPLLLVLYPVWETLFSAYRRRVLRGRPASSADKLHMHTLFYKRVRHPGQPGAPTRRNSDASVSMMLFAGGSTLPAVLWWFDGALLLAAALAYVAIYLAIYRRLVRFGSRRNSRWRTSGTGYVARRFAAFQRSAESRRTVREANKSR
jgi:UDP-GlcNAc:undecaprenyl-phosphate/decaprenyl-phosphate GlcNAc-1-phosphate transferase